MKAIILSAGQGRRLFPLTESTPKCCLDVAGKCLLEWQLQEISRCAVDEVIVITGFANARVEEVVERERAIKARTLHNPFYALSDNLGTCWVARHEMDQPFLIINGDTLFEASVLDHLLSTKRQFPITLATDQKRSYDDDDMKVFTSDGKLLRVGKKLDRQHVNGESIGMMVFDDTGAAIFRAKVEALMKTQEGLTRWYLSAIDELAQDGHVGVCSIHGMNWCEIDDHDDLKKAGVIVPSWHTSDARSPLGVREQKA